MAFSQRRQEIERRMAASGFSGARAAQLIALETRQAKRDYDEAAMKAEWQTRAAAYGINHQQISAQAQRRAGRDYPTSRATLEEALVYSRTHNTEREAVIDRRALEAAALQQSMGRTDLDQVRLQIGREERNRQLIRAGKPNAQHPQGAHTTDEMLALERENLELVRGGQGRASAIAQAAAITAWGQRKGLLPDQIRVAEVTLAATDWVTAIEGLAGATKTTTVGAIRELAAVHGCTVRGFGPTSGSVKALREAGLEARTVASLLADPLSASTAKELWIIDESSLLATGPRAWSSSAISTSTMPSRPGPPPVSCSKLRCPSSSSRKSAASATRN
jgi:hypothetical protein